MHSSTSDPAPEARPVVAVALALVWLGAVLAALTIALGLASLAGAWTRSGLLVPEEAPLPETALTYTDAPDAGRFFDTRDTVTVTVPWPMTVAEFLALYHLENNAGARQALREQLAVRSDADPLERGAQLSFHLTERREVR